MENIWLIYEISAVNLQQHCGYFFFFFCLSFFLLSEAFWKPWVNAVLFLIAAGSRTSLVDHQRQIATVPRERMEAVISSEFMAHCDDKEEIWAGVKVSNKCSKAACTWFEMEMSATFVVRLLCEMQGVCQTRPLYKIHGALTWDCFCR